MDDSPVVAMRRRALDGVGVAAGGNATRRQSQTYRTPGGKEFHLRTRQRDEQDGGWARYWFGIRERLWRPEDYFVLVCGFDFVLVVPVSAWLPYMDRFSVSNAGPEQARQPHIYWRNGTYELREASRTDPLVLDVRPWVDNFAQLA